MPTVDQLQGGKAVCARLLFSSVHTHTAKLYSVRVPSWRVSYLLLPMPHYPLLPSFCYRSFPIPYDNRVGQVLQVSSGERYGRPCSWCNDVCLNWLFVPHHIVCAIHAASSGSSSATSTHLFMKSVRSCIEGHFIFGCRDVQPFLNSYSTIFTVFEEKYVARLKCVLGQNAKNERQVRSR